MTLAAALALPSCAGGESAPVSSPDAPLLSVYSDLMYGEFPTMVEVDGFLDGIIRGIEEIRIRYKSITDEHGDEGEFDEDRENDDEFSTK